MSSGRSAMVEKWLKEAQQAGYVEKDNIAEAGAEASSSSSPPMIPKPPPKKVESPPRTESAAQSASGPESAPAQLVAQQPAEPKAPALPADGILGRRRQLMTGFKMEVHKKTGYRPVVKMTAEEAEAAEKREQLQAEMAKAKKKKAITYISDFASMYEIGKRVQQSTNAGMDVLFATRISDGTEVVIKTRVKSESFPTKTNEKDWRRSTEMLLNLPTSENIAHLHEVLEDSTTYYIVMEKCVGMDLYDAVHGEGVMPLDEARIILQQLLAGVRDLHARGCIHKDLKLENVMVDSPRSPRSPRWFSPCASPHPYTSPAPSPTIVKLIDFDTVELFSPVGHAKTVVGTDQYIAPEAYAGRYSPASDIFSIGVIAYKLICGRFPFPDDTFDDQPGENWVGSPQMASIRNRLRFFTIDWEGEIWAAAPEGKELAKWMLEKNREDRPTAEKALDHAFFADLPRIEPVNPEDADAAAEKDVAASI